MAVAGPTVAGAIAARSRTVRLSGETAAKQTVRHPDLRPADYAIVQRLLDDGEWFMARRRRHAIGFLEAGDQLWTVVVKATADGAETYLQTLRKAQAHNLVAVRHRLKPIITGR